MCVKILGDSSNFFSNYYSKTLKYEQNSTSQSNFAVMASNGQQFGEGEDKLLSLEKLDRSSPDLWPEKIPGVTEFKIHKNFKKSAPSKWMADLEKDDINLLQEFGSLTLSQLMEKVRGLQNLAYQLGLEEAREMTRGKFLNILARPKGHR